jgi:HAD superfamily hydrolase (TIGR01456 family)
MFRVCFRVFRRSSGRCSFSVTTQQPLAVKQPLAFVFDIDGVLLRGSTPLAGARQALTLLLQSHTPFLLLTNGGGELESAKAAKLSKLLSLPIHPSQVVLSHTPMRPLCRALGPQARVLVLGCRDVLSVARAYGLSKIDTPMDLLRDTPTLYPFLDVAERKPLPHAGEPFAAVLVLHDPNNWGLELQVTLDVLRGGSPLGSGQQQAVPYYASNADLTFAGAYPVVPRLAGGAFTTALQALWAHTMPQGGPLTTTFYGKPTSATFQFATHALGAWAAAAAASAWHRRALQGPPTLAAEESQAMSELVAAAEAAGTSALPQFERIVMVGDNPLADIRGANNSGAPWLSALVKTGVWKGEALQGDCKPQLVFDGVLDAVQAELQYAGLPA